MDQNKEVKELIDKINDGVTNVFNSEDFKNYLKFMSGFTHYSFNNQMLIWSQMPSASLCAGYKAWQEKGRFVKKGEKGIRILAPMRITLQVEDEDGEADEIKILRFKSISVFDISQTDGEPLNDICHELTESVTDFEKIKEIIFSISPVPIFIDLDESVDAKGYYGIESQSIHVKMNMSDAQTIKTLLHEITHSILHANLEKKAKEEKEIEAEAVAFIVSNHLGIDTSDYSFEYIASWSKNRELPELKACLSRISETASDMINKLDSLMGEEVTNEQISV